ncbi:BTAD domain-containing putative transcriptional regulator [Dactylosporangium sp. CA-092794]|uniref:BTAD domain-containing putative transcriptional regulator n=1 Tax=Dactylosporangium sp. CA-092794 TaxID=3239929 RepID=UPI003D90DC4E
MLMHRLGRLIVRAASLLTTLALLAGLPTALAFFVGWPLPRHVPTKWAGWAHVLTGGFPDTAVINLLAVALWLVWAAFCYSLAGEIAAARRGRPARQVKGISPLQALAALLVAGMSAGPAAASAALVLPPAVVTTVAPPPVTAAATTTAPTPAGGSLTQTSLPWLTVTTGHQPAQPITATNLPSRPTTTTNGAAMTGLPRFALAAQTGPLTVAAGGQHYTVTVHRGDTLWDLAGAWLGDPHRWPEIYHLNADRYDQHGRMHHGDHIEPTWVLTLPDDATPPPGARPGNPPQQQPGTQTQPSPGQSTAPAPSTNPTPSATATPSSATSAASATPSATASPAAPSATASATTDPDGVVGPPPAGTGSASTATSPSPSASSDPAPTRSPATPSRPHGVELPGGSWLDMGLATAIIAAVALVWAHRRRRYTLRPPSPDLRLDDPDVAPMPPVVQQIRRRLRRAEHDAAARQRDPADAAPLDLLTDEDETLEHAHLLARDDTDADADMALEPDGEDVDEDAVEDNNEDEDDEFLTLPTGSDATGEQAPAAVRPVVPSLAHPLVAVWPPAGLGLTGPGAEAAARGFLAAGLAAGGLDEPDERSWVVMPSATAATLLGADAVALPYTPRLTVTGGLDEALDLLEAQTLHRSRIVYAHEVDTVAELRAADPTEEPLPPILLLADATTRHQRTRIAALLAQGQRLDIHGVLLGAWPDGNTVVVAADGTTSPADGEGARHGHHPADIGRLAILTPTETSDLLATLAESHTGAPQAPAPVEPAAQQSTPASTAAPHHGTPAHATSAPEPTDPAAAPDANLEDPPGEQATVSGSNDARIDGSALPDAATDAAAEPVVPAQAVEAGHPGSVEADAAVEAQPTTRPAADAGNDAEDEDGDAADDDAAEEPDAGDDADAGPGRVEVTVLGSAGIVDVPPGPTLRKKSAEVLVYLAVHDGDASAEAILDDVMPDAPSKKAPGRLYTYVSNLRTVMRHTGGRGTYITHPGQRYVLNTDAVDVDLWRMRAAIRDADQATDPQDRLAALRRAVDTYGGPLADGADYEWIEPYREAVRVQALDAFLALAEALADKPAEQIAVVEAAIRHNPYTEQLYQQAMRARATLGHLDAIRTLRRTLTRALGDIDAEPSDETIALADELVAQAQRAGRRPELRPAPRPGDGAAA